MRALRCVCLDGEHLEQVNHVGDVLVNLSIDGVLGHRWGFYCFPPTFQATLSHVGNLVLVSNEQGVTERVVF